MIEINYRHELLTAAAEALRNRDVETLEQLIRVAQGWLQPREETEAQVEFLEAMLEAVYDLQGYEQTDN